MSRAGFAAHSWLVEKHRSVCVLFYQMRRSKSSKCAKREVPAVSDAARADPRPRVGGARRACHSIACAELCQDQPAQPCVYRGCILVGVNTRLLHDRSPPVAPTQCHASPRATVTEARPFTLDSRRRDAIRFPSLSRPADTASLHRPRFRGRRQDGRRARSEAIGFATPPEHRLPASGFSACARACWRDLQAFATLARADDQSGSRNHCSANAGASGLSKQQAAVRKHDYALAVPCRLKRP